MSRPPDSHLGWWRVIPPLAAATTGLWLSIVLWNYSELIADSCRDGWNCDKVLSSRFSTLAGFKLSQIGALFYSFSAVALIGSVALRTSPIRRGLLEFLFYICILAVVFSSFLLCVQAFVIKAFCPLCCLSVLCSGALLAGLIFWRQVDPWLGQPFAALLLGLWPCLAAAAAIAPVSSRAKDTVLAVVDGEEITEAQMRREISLSLYPMEDALFETKESWLKQKIADRLLQSEARSRDCSVETLLTKLDPAFASQDEIRRIKMLADFSGLQKEAADPAALPQLERRKLAKEEFAKLVDSHGAIVINLKKPVPPAIQFDLREAPKLGDTNSPVKLVVFSDFECPFCALLADRIRAMSAEFPHLLVAFKFFPLLSHARSIPTAMAAACAGRQGKFWAYHDGLFSQPGRRSDADLEDIAIETGIDTQMFRACLRDPATTGRIMKDYEEAVRLGIDSVPSVFLNGELIGGVPETDELRGLIQRATTSH